MSNKLLWIQLRKRGTVQVLRRRNGVEAVEETWSDHAKLRYEQQTLSGSNSKKGAARVLRCGNGIEAEERKCDQITTSYVSA
jgi:hypothetical protein